MSTAVEEITPAARQAVERRSDTRPPGALPADATIHQRMVRIVAELPAIGKDQRNEQQHFMFRGYDDVLNALNPLLGEHGVYVVPDVVERVTGERTTRSGGTMYEVNLHVRFRFYGLAGDSVEASGWGEGTDSGDKATNKAMTMALKYVLFQAFAISTKEASDADAVSPEETTRYRPAAGGGDYVDEPAARGFPVPKNWPQIKQSIVGGYASGELVYADFEAFIAAAAEHLYQEPSLKALSVEDRKVMGQKAAGAAVYVRDHCDNEIEGPSLELMQEAWASVLDGIILPLPVAEPLPEGKTPAGGSEAVSGAEDAPGAA